MDNRIRTGKRKRQPIPGSDINVVYGNRNFRRTACAPRFDGSRHIVAYLRQCRDDVGSDEAGITRYDNPQWRNPFLIVSMYQLGYLEEVFKC